MIRLQATIEAARTKEVEHGNIFLIRTIESRLKVIEVNVLMDDYVTAYKLVELLLIDMKIAKDRDHLKLSSD